MKAGSHGLVKPYGGSYGTGSKSMKDGGSQIEYEDEDPSVRAMFDAVCAERGVEVTLANAGD